MENENHIFKVIFYSIGILFLFITIGYFIGDYLEYLPTNSKTFLIFFLVLIFFLLSDYLSRRNL